MTEELTAPRAVEGAGAMRLAWNSERLDSMLRGLATLQPIAKTGVKALDDMLGGGLCPGVHVISALPGCGKSTLCGQIADYIARFGKRRVLYVSLEMTEAALLAKSLVRLSCEIDRKVPLSQAEIVALLRSGAVGGEGPRARIFTEAVEVYRADVAPNLATCCDFGTVREIASAVDAAMAGGEHSPIVFVDYLQLLRPSAGVSAGAQVYEVVTDVMRGLCSLASEYKTAVIAISSQNRQSRGSSKDMAALSGSSEIEYGATSVLFMASDDNGSAVKAYVRKNRFGPSGRFEMTFRPSEARFTE